jgi:hypothetical protein
MIRNTQSSSKQKHFMLKSLPSVLINFSLAGLIACLVFTSVQAAPLDALLHTNGYSRPGELYIEVSYDAANQKLDIFKMRASEPAYDVTSVGDYRGAHLRMGYALTDRWKLDGALWSRQINYRTDYEPLTSWLLAGQYYVFSSPFNTAHLDLRLSAWGNSSSKLVKNSPTSIDGRTVTNVNINFLNDVQQQLDAIVTWQLNDLTKLSGFLGGGYSMVATGDITANYTNSSGCNYLMTFAKAGVSGQRTNTCRTPGPTLDSFGATENILPALSYTAKYIQLGGNLSWQNQVWSLAGGYQYTHHIRNDVDDAIASAGATPYKSNHILVGEVKRKLSSNTALMVRGQLMSNQFVGEVPFFYNQITSSKFGKRYGIATIGLVAYF